MKIDSKILAILSALLVVGIAISSVGAVDLGSNGINSANFAIDIPSGSDFAEEATTNLNVGDVAMNMEVFANHGDNANDLNTIVYLKDDSKDKSIISDVINDLKKDAPIVEENDKYFVLETKDANNNWDFLNFDIGNDIDSLWNFATGIFSDDSNVNVTTESADVQVSENEGIHIVGDDNSTVSLSTKGLAVSDPTGDNVSISTDGVNIDSNGENSVDVDSSVDGDMISHVTSADYAIVLESPDHNQVIVIAGNDLELLKSIAETASFTN